MKAECPGCGKKLFREFGKCYNTKYCIDCYEPVFRSIPDRLSSLVPSLEVYNE